MSTGQSFWAQVPVLKRLVPSIRKRLTRLVSPSGYTVVEREGVRFLLNLENWYDKVILTHGPFEPLQRAYLLENIASRGCDTFLDIGANMGTYTMFVARQGRCSTMIAFEPDYRSYDKLRTHLMLNGFSERVDTRMAAVSNRGGTLSFKPGPDTHDALSMIDEISGTRSIVAIRLDDEIKLTGKVVAIKIDVEGHELTALEGMTKFLKYNRCFLQVECFPENASAYIAAMKSQGYNLIRNIDRDHYFANF